MATLHLHHTFFEGEVILDFAVVFGVCHFLQRQLFLHYQRVQGDYAAENLVVLDPPIGYFEYHLVRLESRTQKLEDELFEFHAVQTGLKVDFEDFQVHQFEHNEVHFFGYLLEFARFNEGVAF